MNTSSELTERQAFLVLNALPNIGPITTNRLLQEFDGDVCAIFSAPARRLESVKGVGSAIRDTLLDWQKHFDLSREVQRLEAAQADFI
ncbi:MAG TPA: DNA-protecting protein DprA, partial [Opitutaceae bacterium]|nr:DNA-protecting protein DprA [Opitutaceae bacterium]